MKAEKWSWSISSAVLLLLHVEGMVDVRGEISFDLLYPDKQAQATSPLWFRLGETDLEVTKSKAINRKVTGRRVKHKESIKEGKRKSVVTELEQLKAIMTDVEVQEAEVTESEVTKVRTLEVLSNITKAVPVECVYQYPDKAQVDAMLSNMMNQLTRMYVRVDNFLRLGYNRKHSKRFTVVTKMPADIFDSIYMNMTEEYSRFANHTQSSIFMKARGDPCEHQAEIREIWRALLDSSREAVRRAALSCVEEYLRAYGENDSRSKGRARSRASQMLRGEMAGVHSDQLTMLCDQFQLCYSELL